MFKLLLIAAVASLVILKGCAHFADKKEDITERGADVPTMVLPEPDAFTRAPAAPPQVNHSGPITEPITRGAYFFKHRPVPSLEVFEKSFKGEVQASVDRALNAVYFSVPDSQYERVAAFFPLLDIEAAQVRLEVIVAMATLSDSQSFGFAFLGDYVDGADNVGGWALSALVDGGAILSAGYSDVFRAAISAAAATDRFEVVTRPTVTVTAGDVGTITSGREIGIASTNSQVGNLVTTIEFRSVALTLEFLPEVLGDMIYLEVKQQNEDVISTSEIGGNEVPEIGHQSFVSRVRVPNGSWLYCGGVTVVQDTKGRQGMPGIVKRPLLGRIFGKSKSEHVRQELGVFVRPVIVGSDTFVEAAEQEILRAARSLTERPLPVPRGGLGEPKIRDRSSSPAPSRKRRRGFFSKGSR